MSGDSVNGKRQRVLRACNECRKKKVKCDGKNPCIHCKVYNYDCSYGSVSSKRSRSVVSDLQCKISSYESFLKTVFPGLKLSAVSDTDLKKVEQLMSNFSPECSEEIKKVIELVNGDNEPSVKESAHFDDDDVKSDMVENPEYQSQMTNFKSPAEQVVKISLPPLDDTLRLVHTACDSAFLFKFYNRLNLIKIIREFYSNAVLEKTSDTNHNRRLAFIYSFLAVGALLENDSNAYNYYNASYSLLKKKIIETNDVLNIQTLFCLIIFLQCTANLSTCYSFVGIALRSAFRVGLHRKVEIGNAIALENRKRLFWSIYKIDIYMNTVLGLPQISDDEIDQDLPLDIEDEYITETGYLTPKTPNRYLTTVAISNDHTKLIIIMNHIVKNIYPINTDHFYQNDQNSITSITPNFIHSLISKVKLMETELSNWLAQLPVELNPENPNIPVRFYKQNRLLKLAYLHVQLALYRPFIHLISYKYIQRSSINRDSIKHGMNCINIAIKIVELAIEIHEHQLLNGAYWFSIYPIFYSVACLVYYIHENSDSSFDMNVREVTVFAEKGKDVLVDLKNSSMAAARTYQTLNIMFEKLNRRAKKFHVNHDKYFEDGVTPFGQTALKKEEHFVTNPLPSFQLDMDYLGNPNKLENPINQETSSSQNMASPSDSQRYYSSMIDKFDMNVFGRFLPPYMLQSKTNNTHFAKQMSKTDSNLQFPNMPMIPSDNVQGSVDSAEGSSITVPTSSDNGSNLESKLAPNFSYNPADIASTSAGVDVTNVVDSMNFLNGDKNNTTIDNDSNGARTVIAPLGTPTPPTTNSEFDIFWNPENTIPEKVFEKDEQAEKSD